MRILLKNKVKHLTVVCLLIVIFVFNSISAKCDEAKPTGDYAGSEKCKECHSEQYDGWQNTLHSRVVQDAKKNPESVLGDLSDERAKEFIDKYEIEFTVGSHWSQRYLVKIKDEYYALPIVWSIVTKSWDDFSVLFWNKMPYSKYCIGCHTTNYDPKTKTYSEHHIGCEACHGPGGKHVESEGDATLIVNPAKLPDTLREMICAACHVRGKDNSGKYKFPIGYQPGKNLADYLVVAKAEDETNEEAILYQFEEWKKTRKSPKKCSICCIKKPDSIASLHDTNASAEASCISCHNYKDQTLVKHTHHSLDVEISCSDCHKTKEEDATVERNIHSYDYYLVHRVGCYYPYIEKYCMECHKDKAIDWATSLVIDWAVPEDVVHDE